VTDKSNAELEVLGTAVHDLKNPLASIKSFADLVVQNGPLNERQVHYLGRIQLAVENMTNLINSLLDLVWIEEGMQLTPSLCNLVDILRSQINAFEASARERDIRIELSADDNVIPIHADARRIGQAVGNLLSNSIKYNRPNGLIQIHVTREESNIRVTIKDSGIGIAEKDMPHIFDRFYRGSRKSPERIEGSGLGLSIVKAIIEMHHGSIWAESSLNEGSVFVFTLPLD